MFSMQLNVLDDFFGKDQSENINKIKNDKKWFQ
jgi:hypothetical protein